MTARHAHIALSLLTLGAVGWIFAQLLGAHLQPSQLSALAADYIALSSQELGVANTVTGILLAYRSFDTLGEVAVLYMATASLGLLLQPMPRGIGAEAPRRSDHPGEIIESGQMALLPLIAVFGTYVILFGHLSAGGGFQGGAIIATGVELYMIARVTSALPLKAFSLVESGAGLLFLGAGLLGLWFAGGFLDPRFLPAGEPGRFLSGGAIPLISLLLGVKVAAEIAVILERFRA